MEWKVLDRVLSPLVDSREVGGKGRENDRALLVQQTVERWMMLDTAEEKT